MMQKTSFPLYEGQIQRTIGKNLVSRLQNQQNTNVFFEVLWFWTQEFILSTL